MSRSVLVGLAAGLLFFAHAFLIESQAWPLIWPFLGGLFSLSLSAAMATDHPTVRDALGAAARAGLACGGVFFVLSSVLLLAAGMPVFEAAAASLETEEAVMFTASMFLPLLITASVGFACSLFAGVLVGPMVRAFDRS
jgi:hypothetical protein